MRALVILLLLAATYVPTAAADCRFAPMSYACTAEEPDDCGGYTAIGAGVNGVVGAAVAGFDGCNGGYTVATASVATVYVTLVWYSDGANCFFAPSVSLSPVPTTAPCPGGVPPPNPGWGNVLP